MGQTHIVNGKVLYEIPVEALFYDPQLPKKRLTPSEYQLKNSHRFPDNKSVLADDSSRDKDILHAYTKELLTIPGTAKKLGLSNQFVSNRLKANDIVPTDKVYVVKRNAKNKKEQTA